MKLIFKQQGKPSSIYVVDDNETIGDLKKRMLSKDGLAFDKINLIYGAQTLDQQYDNKLISSVGMKDGSIFYHAKKILGG